MDMTDELVLVDEPTEEERNAEFAKKQKVAGAWLRRERESMGWSQADLAIEINYLEGRSPAPNTIARWERGEMRPQSKYLPVMARLLGHEPRLMNAILRHREVNRIPPPVDPA